MDAQIENSNTDHKTTAKAALVLDTGDNRRYIQEEKQRSRRPFWLWKRAWDVALSLLAMIVLLPLLLVIALVVYIDDPSGSPIFSQMRVGRHGKEFRFYKFRSMRVDAEDQLDELMHRNEMDGPVFKIKDDPRVTRVGKFIRKTSLDELPQLWNIFIGDMSIVGPRPALPREVAQYDEYEKQRLFVQPGLTCFWQIQPNRNAIPFNEWMALDVKYVRERSILTDCKIIIKTIPAVFHGEGV